MKTTNVGVYHRRDPSFTVPTDVQLRADIEQEKYRKVATVAVRTSEVGRSYNTWFKREHMEVLERAYALTQNIDYLWMENAEILNTPQNPQADINGRDGRQERSTSIGDLLSFQLRFFVVTRDGFKEIRV